MQYSFRLSCPTILHSIRSSIRCQSACLSLAALGPKFLTPTPRTKGPWVGFGQPNLHLGEGSAVTWVP